MTLDADGSEKKRDLFTPPPCACRNANSKVREAAPQVVNKFRYFGTGLAALLIWCAAYAAALPLARELAGLLSAGNARLAEARR